MHNSMCCWKLKCLVCACDRDCSRIIIGIPAQNPMSASTEWNPKSKYLEHRLPQNEGMGPLASIRAFSAGYQGESIEHSLKQTEIPNFKRTDSRKGNSHTCQSFAASTEQNSKLQANRKAQVNEDDGARSTVRSDGCRD